MTSEKSYDTAQRLDALLSAGMIAPLTAFKTTTEGRSSTSFADDSDLQLTVVGGQRYLVCCQIQYSGGAGASAGDFKWTFTVPGGASEGRYSADFTSGGLGYGGNKSLYWNSNTDYAGTDGVSNPKFVSCIGTLKPASSGQFIFRWAKQATSDTTTRVEDGSILAAWAIE